MDLTTAFNMLQLARQAAEKSLHRTNKVGGALWLPGREGEAVTGSNEYPQGVLDHFGPDQKIGDASPTVHMETKIIVSAPFPTDGASLVLTDPPCPNCAKNIAEGGLRNVYLDAAGFRKDFFRRRGADFENMSMKIIERAGVHVTVLDPVSEKEKRIDKVPKDYVPPNDSPPEIEPVESLKEAVFLDIIAKAEARHAGRNFSVALVRTPEGENRAVVMRRHLVEGFTMSDPDEALDILARKGKYSFAQESVNRMLMYCARHGYEIQPDYLYCSQIPTSREQVNLLGAGYNRITVGDTRKSRGDNSRRAMDQLRPTGLMAYT
jgi:dCMP deaminase